MNLLKTFESRISDAFGASPEGYTAPFSFKKLARRTAREMENETFEIDGVDTAPALYTLLVSPQDDATMRPLYPQLTREIVSFVEAQASSKSYVFVGKPLARFMVDPSLKSGHFAIFAENVDAQTLGRLREEEQAFLSGSLGTGGAAAQVAPVSGHSQHMQERKSSYQPQQMPAVQAPLPQQAPAPAPAQVPQQDFAPVAQPAQVAEPMSEDSIGLNVMPDDVVDQALQDIYEQNQIEPPAAASNYGYKAPVVSPDDSHVQPVGVPVTQRREMPRPNRQAPTAGRHSVAAMATCLLIDNQSGTAYTAYAPSTPIGRERIQGAIVLQDPNASRRHAEITYDGRNWHIADLGSTNGTLVNDQDIDICTLKDGDVITIGLTNLVFRERLS